jgi:cytochrome b pre-mRNA-processing protein 3
MFNFFHKGQVPYKNESFALYHTAMAQARNPIFFEKMSVPDTVEGRFEMVCAHVALIIARISLEAEKAEHKEDLTALSQAVFDAMFIDMEESLRQIGIGDMGIPRRMKHMMQSLNGRIHLIGAAAYEGDEKQLNAAIKKNIYGTVEKAASKKNLDLMRVYLLETAQILKDQPIQELFKGRVTFK